MYNIYIPNEITDEELLDFIDGSADGIVNEGNAPILLRGGDYVQNTLKLFKRKDCRIHKQTKNGEPIVLRYESLMPHHQDEGYFAQHFALMKPYEGSKSYIFDKEYFDCWFEYLKDLDYLGFYVTVIENREMHLAYERGIPLGLLGDNVVIEDYYELGRRVPRTKKIKVTI